MGGGSGAQPSAPAAGPPDPETPTCPTEARGTPARVHPVPLHPLQEPQGRHGHLVVPVAELQQVGEARDVQAGVCGRHVSRCRPWAGAVSPPLAGTAPLQGHPPGIPLHRCPGVLPDPQLAALGAHPADPADGRRLAGSASPVRGWGAWATHTTLLLRVPFRGLEVRSSVFFTCLFASFTPVTRQLTSSALLSTGTFQWGTGEEGEGSTHKLRARELRETLIGSDKKAEPRTCCLEDTRVQDRAQGEEGCAGTGRVLQAWDGSGTVAASGFGASEGRRKGPREHFKGNEDLEEGKAGAGKHSAKCRGRFPGTNVSLRQGPLRPNKPGAGAGGLSAGAGLRHRGPHSTNALGSTAAKQQSCVSEV